MLTQWKAAVAVIPWGGEFVNTRVSERNVRKLEAVYRTGGLESMKCQGPRRGLGGVENRFHRVIGRINPDIPLGTWTDTVSLACRPTTSRSVLLSFSLTLEDQVLIDTAGWGR